MEKNHELVNCLRVRGVLHLVHFTPLENITSILTRGLISRDRLTTLNIPFRANDRERRDNYSSGTCLSFTHPNIRLLKYWMQKYGGHWVVLLIDPTIIASMQCKLFRGNAASSIRAEINNNYAPSVANFEELFRDEAWERLMQLKIALGSDGDFSALSKNKRGWKPEDTNDPQSEVIIFEDIPPAKIEAIVVSHQNALISLHSRLMQETLEQWVARSKVSRNFFEDKKRVS